MKNFLLTQGWGLLVLVLPFIFPNDKVYLWARATVGKAIAKFTVYSQDKPWKSLAAYLFNTVAAIASAISDEVRGIPPKESAGGKTVRERVNAANP